MDTVLLLPSHYATGVRQSLRRQHRADLIIMGSLDIDSKYVFSYKGQSIFEVEISQALLRERLQPRDCFAIKHISITAFVFTGPQNKVKLP